jgi:hypothetical protein
MMRRTRGAKQHDAASRLVGVSGTVLSFPVKRGAPQRPPLQKRCADDGNDVVSAASFLASKKRNGASVGRIGPVKS